MAQTAEFYHQREQEARAEAKRAKLANVRERALRAAQTWKGLADQAKLVARRRERAEVERAKRRAAEAAASEAMA